MSRDIEKLTVIMAVYNGMPYLQDSIESILNQSLKEYKFVIVNDGSTDGTKKYLNSLNDKRIKIIHQDNAGQGAAANTAIYECDTEFIARMDSDDISAPERLLAEMMYIEQHEDVVLVSTQVDFISNKKVFSGPYKPTDHESIRKSLIHGNAAVCHGACMMRTSAIKKLGGYRIKRSGLDIDMFLRISEIGKLANIDKILYHIRVHKESVCYKDRSKINMARSYAVKCSKHREKNISEPNYDEFKKIWETRNLYLKVKTYIEGWSGQWYRQAMIDMANSKTMRGYWKLFIAAAFRPKGTLRRINGWVLRVRQKITS